MSLRSASLSSISSAEAAEEGDACIGESTEDDSFLDEMLRCRVMPISSSGPYIRRVISDIPGELVYDGYFYCERMQFPMERLIVRRTPVAGLAGVKRTYVHSVQHVEIYEKISGEDTSEYSETTADVSDGSGSGICDDDDFMGGGVCFFPTEIVTLRYRVLEDEVPDARYEELRAKIRATMEPRLPPTFQAVSSATELSASDISEL